MKSFVKGALATSLLAASSMTMADTTGLYGFFNIQQATLDTSVQKNSTTLALTENFANNPNTFGFNVASQGNFTLDDTSAMSASLGLGYMFTDNFGVEVAYNNYKIDDDVKGTEELIGVDNLGAATSIDASIKLDAAESISVAGIAQTSAGEGFAVFAKVGAEAWRTRLSKTVVMGQHVPHTGQTDDGYDFFVGFGFKMDISEHMALTNEYSWHKLDGNETEIDIQTISLGLQYQF